MRFKIILAVAFVALTALFAGLTALSAQAQTRPDRQTVMAKDTSINTDTVTVQFNSIESNVTGFQASVYKLSGTASGYVLLQGTINGSDWVNASPDSLVLVNQDVNSRVWPITVTAFNSYRLLYRSSGTQTSTLGFSYLRRPGE